MMIHASLERIIRVIKNLEDWLERFENKMNALNNSTFDLSMII